MTATTPARPLFCVVMPAFRAEQTIGVAVASVLLQSEGDFELIVVDDGSPDGTAAVARRVAGGDSRVRILRVPNSGPARGRNLGIAAGTGRLLAFLDADDRWQPDLLARHRDHFAARPDLGISFARVRFWRPGEAGEGRLSAHVRRLSLDRALGENLVCTTSNLVARREVVAQAGGFDEALAHAEDQEWIARVLAVTAWQARGIDAVLVDYRTSPGGLSADLDRMEAGWQAMIARIRRHAPAEVAAAEAPARALFERYLARRALRTGQPARVAWAHLAAAARSSPRTLLLTQPARTLLTVAGALAASCLPQARVCSLLAR